MERVWFSDPIIDGLFHRALKGRITPALIARLKPLGLDLDKPLKPAYPAEICVPCVKLVARELFPQLSEADALYQLGRINTDGYATTLIGKAMLGVMRAIGPKRTVPRIGRAFKTGTNYLEVVTTEVLPDRFKVHFNEVDGIPTYYKGIVDRGTELLASPRTSAEYFETDGHQMTLYMDARDSDEGSRFPR